MAKILVVDDERPIVEAISYNLRKEGYEVMTAADAQECVAVARRQPPDLVVLDIMLPSGSGLDVCRQLRLEHGNIPVLLLTARAEEDDRIRGFDSGADDYVVKPFSMRELLARVRALLRRRTVIATLQPASEAIQRIQRPDDKVVTIGDLVIDRSRREITVSGRKVDLSRKEFDLLVTLASNRGQVFDRQTLLNRVWGEDCYVEDRTVDVHIRWLREKIETVPSRPERLLTVRGIGYKFAQ
ncbi:MAG: response regulator transcription factor [Capsulimonadaceae bacterium]|nr:response regulator transcription factor [Capsulimonadaceae bacterium]